MIPGPVYALLTAVAWSIAVIFFTKSGDSISPVGLNVFKNLVGLTLFLLTLPFVNDAIPDAPTRDYLLLFGSGVVGIGIADTLFFHSLNLLGASRAAVVDCAYSPLIVFFSFVLLGEVLSPLDGVGGLLIVLAVALTISRSEAGSLSRKQLLTGATYGIVSMALMGVAIVVVKPVLDRHPVLWCTTVRISGGVFVLVLWAFASRRVRASVVSALIPSRAWRYAVPGAFMGTYVSLLFWVAGFKYNTAGVASILNQTATVFTVILAAAFLKDPLTPRRAVAVVLAFTGSALVLL